MSNLKRGIKFFFWTCKDMPPKRTPAIPIVPRRGRPRTAAPPRRGGPRATASAYSTNEEAVAPAPAPVEEVKQSIGARDMAAIV